MKKAWGFIFKKEELKFQLYFWAFWFSIIALFFGLIKSSPSEGLLAGAIVVIPYIIPVYILSIAFDWLLTRRKIIYFFPLLILAGWLLGLLINEWFEWIIDEANFSINNEILIFIFAGINIGFKYIRLVFSQRILLKEAENKRIVSELQLLRAQMNPHFLFNALNSIYSLNLSQSEKTGEAILSLSELMRFHLDSSGKQFVPLETEIDMINRYIELERIRLGNKCLIETDIQTGNSALEIPPLILIPFVENAFKHGISNDPAKNRISIKLHTGAENLEFEIINFIPDSKQNSGTMSPEKTGISNTRKRLDLHYPSDYLLETKNDGRRFHAILKIKSSQK